MANPERVISGNTGLTNKSRGLLDMAQSVGKECKMLVSVIVPFLNEEPFIEGYIHALLNQTFDRHQYELAHK